jgi:hypothetical protein
MTRRFIVSSDQRAYFLGLFEGRVERITRGVSRRAALLTEGGCLEDIVDIS